MQDVEIIETNFEAAYEIWSQNLWKGRSSPIRGTSSLCFRGGHDLSYHRNPAVFFLACAGGVASPAGIVSGFQTGPGYFRCRGLFVFPQYRGNGIAQALLRKISQAGSVSGNSYLWTMPRKESWRAYEKFGFTLDSDWFEEKMEFGPNAFASLRLNTQF